MKHNLLNFTRGSQLLGHFGFMFAAGLKGPLIVTVIVVAAMSYWQVASHLGDHQFYLAWMHLYASLYGFMEFDPAKLVNLRLETGEVVAFPFGVVREFPPMRDAIAAFQDAIWQAIIHSALFLVPLFIAFWWFAERFGEKSKQKKHVRGASLASLPELEELIAEHNRKQMAREYGKELGWKWRIAGSAALAEAGFYVPARLAGVSWPWRREQSHAMLVGTTGTGKTVALTELVCEIRKRGQRAVIFDLTGAFIETFFDPIRDVILNPLDARCPSWSVFNDCASKAEFYAAAESLVPHDGGGSEQFWVLSARTLFVETCLKLSQQGRRTNEALASELMNADLTRLHELLEETMAGPISSPKAARMAESVRAVFNVNAKAMQLLPEDGPEFSVKDWVKGRCGPGSILFLSARYVDMSVLSQLLTLWLDTSINTLMTMRRTADLKLWFLIDELGALHRLPSLEKGLQTARNFGGAIVTGVHAFAKLKEVYGENMAMTLSSLSRTKLILATSDRETATWCSDVIGQREVREMEEGYSYGYNNARDAVSLTPRRQVVPLLLPDEIMEFESLSGYIKFPDGFPAASIMLEPRAWPRLAEGFIPREQQKMTTALPRPDAHTAGDARREQSGSSDDDGGSDQRGLNPEKPPSPDATVSTEEPLRAHQPATHSSHQAVEQASRENAMNVPMERTRRGQTPSADPRDGLPLFEADQRRQSQGLDQEVKLDGARPDRSDVPGRQQATRTDRDSERAHEVQQRGLLGGAARAREDRDFGDIDPDF